MGAHVVFYGDNEGAKFRLLGGFSSDRNAALLLSLFWGAAAVHRSRPWITRVASQDNPADCLTKPGLSRDHLADARFDCVDLAPVWDIIILNLRRGSFPEFLEIADLFKSRYQ